MILPPKVFPTFGGKIVFNQSLYAYLYFLTFARKKYIISRIN